MRDLTPETLVWRIRGWGQRKCGVEILFERRRLVEERQCKRQRCYCCWRSQDHPSKMNDQGLKSNISLLPKRLERTVFEDLILSCCQLKPRSLFHKALQILSFSSNGLFLLWMLGTEGQV